MRALREKVSIQNIEDLEDLLSLPTPETVEAMGKLRGDIVILGVGGKMGPTLARMAKRASDLSGVSRRVIGVSRFSSAALPGHLQSWGVEIHSCDLLDRSAYSELPDVANVVYMAGMKFGSTNQEARTWAMNAFLPGMVSTVIAGSRCFLREIYMGSLLLNLVAPWRRMSFDPSAIMR